MRVFTSLIFLFIPLFAFSLDYYWVGGSGNWSDIRHWATASGGNVQHNQIPSANDDVIFDQSSFTGAGQRVTMNLDVIFCRTLDFRNIDQSMVLEGMSSSAIRIHGSLYFHPMVQMMYQGTFEFKGSLTDNELDWAGKSPKSIYFLDNGTWTFRSNVDIDSLIQIQFGSINFLRYRISCERFEVMSATQVNLDFGSSVIDISGDRTRDMITYNWRESLHLEGPGTIVSNPGTSTLILTGVKASIGLYTIQDMDLGTVELGRPGGDHILMTYETGDFRFDKLYLKGNTFIRGSYWMDELELEGGQVFTFSSDYTQTFRLLRANTDCSNYAFIRSSDGGRQAIFVGISGTQVLGYVMIKDVSALGSASFSANNSIDLGGNAGWAFTEKAEEAFYWIRGEGNWSDPMHWSLTSGGPPSGCVPSANDDVVFDQNSFFNDGERVIIDVPSAFCKNMDWRLIDDQAILDFKPLDNISSLHIFGSLWFSNALTNQFDGDVYFESPRAGNTITSAGIEFLSNVYFDGAGDWTLMDKLDVLDSLYFNAGTLNLNNQELEFWKFFSETNSVRTWNLTNSIVRVVANPKHMYYGAVMAINAQNLTINPGKSTVLCESGIDIWSYNDGLLDFYHMIFYGGTGINIDNRHTNSNLTFHAEKMEVYGDGWFNAVIIADTLLFAAGRSYQLNMNTNIIVEDLIADGTCGEGSPFIHAWPKNIQATFTSNSNAIDVSNVMLEGILAEGGATFNASSSFDLGNNEGWNFILGAPRTLYWVNDGGIWFDDSHWSLSSGGPGGECIPTAVDDVIFDANSFTGANRVDLVQTNGSICHNMTWEQVPDFAGIENGPINITGSLSLMKENTSFYPWSIYFRSDSPTNEIRTSLNELPHLVFMGKGMWTLQDDLTTHSTLEMYEGTFVSNDFDVFINRLFVNDYPVDFEKRIVMGNSHWKIGREWSTQVELYLRTANLTFDAGQSLLEFPNPISEIHNTRDFRLTLNNVLFSNNQGFSKIEQYDQANFQFNELTFNNDGLIENDNQMDSLRLAPGKVYQFEEGTTQLVNEYLLARGTNCTPISLISTIPGQQATISGSTIVVDADFVQMQDHRSSGGGNFFAGNNSTDIGNNSGWVFGSPPDHIETGFLGEDRAICTGADIILDAYNFNPSETYLWSNGSVDSAIVINSPGIYFVEVNFANSCVLQDTVTILDPVNFSPDLGLDRLLCEGETVELQADIMAQGARYLWQDQSTSPTFLVDAAGLYWVEVKLGECFAYDTARVDFVALPQFQLQGGQDLCNGDTLLLDVTLPGANYLWSDGSTAPTFSITQDGQYWVDVEANNCNASDTLNISFTPLPAVNLGLDVALCEEEFMTLDALVPGGTYYWQDNSILGTYTVVDPGIYWVDVTQSGCTHRDSITVDYNALPNLDLGSDTSLCSGGTVTFDFTEPNVSYVWSTGNAGGFEQFTQGGLYWLEGELNGCVKSDTIVIDFVALPIVDLGADVTLCEGEVLPLNVAIMGASYNWHDNTQGAEFTVGIPGIFWVDVTQNGCTVRDSVQVQFNPLPVFSLGNDTSLCEGTSVGFDFAEQNVNYLWSNGNASGMETISQTGSYWLEGHLNGCVRTDTVQVVFEPPPNVDLGADRTLCDGEVLTYSFSEPSTSYIWNASDMTGDFEISNSGTYTIEAFKFNCESTDEIEVDYNPIPVFSLGDDQNLCPGESFLINSDRPGTNLNWQDGSANTSFTGNVGGIFWAELTESGCSFRDSVNINYSPTIPVDLGPDTTICENTNISLDVSHPSALSYSWSDGSLGSSILAGQPGRYTVEVSDGFCTFSDEVIVSFRECHYFSRFAPNVFSPNGDGTNDEFKILIDPGVQISSFSFRIFDRWGSQIFETNNPNEGWDGTRNGEALSRSVYIYSLEVAYTDDNGRGKFTEGGDVLLIIN